jgi:LysR family transcriptional regulator, transcriptional activator for leuABCD operon
MFNIRSVDLNLLPVFEAVYEEKSLSRAAVRLAMTQSAISHALSRLRSVFRDELFVRQSRGVVPTPAADRVYPQVRDALASVRESVTDMRIFDAKTSERRFTLSIPHPLGPIIELRLQERLTKIAPKVAVTASTRSRPIDLDDALRVGRVDAAIDWLAPVGSRFNSKLLFEDALIAVARKGHPAFRARVSLKTLQEGRFVGLRPRTDERGGPEHIQAVRRHKLDVVLEVSELLEVFLIASESNLFGLIPRSMEHVARHAFGLGKLTGLPRSPTLPISLYWHSSRETDPGQQFLRKELGAAIADVISGRRARR